MSAIAPSTYALFFDAFDVFTPKDRELRRLIAANGLGPVGGRARAMGIIMFRIFQSMPRVSRRLAHTSWVLVPAFTSLGCAGVSDPAPEAERVAEIT